VDVQPTFFRPIEGCEKILSRIKFLTRMAALLEVPILVSEQVPDKTGSTHPELAQLFPNWTAVFAKTSFGCCECEEFMAAFQDLDRQTAILVGIETHICVSQTALGLMDRGFRVVVCPDAVGSRTTEMHKLGMERIRDEGAIPIHTEGVAYEWLESANHAKFRDALKIVKDAS
jgi:nicotinamidase-related amidase